MEYTTNSRKSGLFIAINILLLTDSSYEIVEHMVLIINQDKCMNMFRSINIIEVNKIIRFS